MRLDRVSERRGEFGGITADGMINVLGRPRLDSLTLVLREAAQNSWDARRRVSDRVPHQPPEFHVRVRTLSKEQECVFREVFHDPAADTELPSTNELRRQLSLQLPIRVLELCDFNTVGLDGSVDPASPAPTGHDNFRNFFFDLGVEHIASGDGGTYGYGRSALYLASRARTILVDSLASVGLGVERRLMACRVGHAHERKGFAGGAAIRYTGRHFWGESNGERGIRPVTGGRAAALAAAIGMPTRDEHATGTSVLIPWPDSDEHMVEGRWAWDALIRHLWPKLVSREGPLAMHIVVLEDGREVMAPDVHRHPVYGLFASALLVARDRSGSSGARPIELQRPLVVTGHLGLEVGTESVAETSVGTDPDGQVSDFDAGVHHVALMRPSELVVRYLEVSGAREDARQWAGVFICVDDPEVRNVFAASEPPAHDDWIPDRIEDKRQRKLVRQTVSRYIPQAVREAFAMANRPVVGSDEPGSLAAAADAFAHAFLQGAGTALGSARIIGSGSSSSRGPRLRGPAFAGLSVEDGARVATYRLSIAGVGAAGVRVRATASIATDGGAVSDVPSGMLQPEVLGWRNVQPGPRAIGPVVRVPSDRELFVDIAFRGEYGIVVSCSIEVES